MPRPPHPQLDAAQAALDAGDLEAAAAGFRRVLDQAGSADPRTAFDATIGLVTSNGRAGRFFEALVFSRRAVAAARGLDDPGRLATGLGGLCVGLINTGGGDRLAGPLQELEQLLAADTEGTLPVAAHRMAWTTRFAQALSADDTKAARHAIDCLRERLSVRPLAEGEAQMLDDFEARLRVQQGDLSRADKHFGNALERRGASVERLDVLLRHADALAQAGERERAAAAAITALALLETRQHEPFRMEAQADLGGRLGVLFQELLDDPERARRAFAIASTALAARLAQVDASVGELLADASQDPDDNAAFLRDLRADFEQAQLKLLAGVVRNLDILQGRGASILIDGPTSATHVSLCAWCQRVQLPGGRWVDLGHFTPEATETPITHGMCRDCYSRVEGDELPALRARRQERRDERG